MTKLILTEYSSLDSFGYNLQSSFVMNHDIQESPLNAWEILFTNVMSFTSRTSRY